MLIQYLLNIHHIAGISQASWGCKDPIADHEVQYQVGEIESTGGSSTWYSKWYAAQGEVGTQEKHLSQSAVESVEGLGKTKSYLRGRPDWRSQPGEKVLGALHVKVFRKLLRVQCD